MKAQKKIKKYKKGKKQENTSVLVWTLNNLLLDKNGWPLGYSFIYIETQRGIIYIVSNSFFKKQIING